MNAKIAYEVYKVLSDEEKDKFRTLLSEENQPLLIKKTKNKVTLNEAMLNLLDTYFIPQLSKNNKSQQSKSSKTIREVRAVRASKS